MIRHHVNLSRKRVPELLAALPKSGEWMDAEQVAQALATTTSQVGRIANLAKRSVLRCDDPQTGRPCFRLVPSLCVAHA